jgi:hypothetical protein
MGAIGLFTTLAIEGASIRGLREAETFETARSWAGLWRLLMPMGIPSMLTVLGAGIYLGSISGVWELAWARVAVPLLVVVAAAGGSLAPRRSRIQAAIAEGLGALPSEVRERLRDRFFLMSLRLRALLLAVLVFEMTVKPDAMVTIWALGMAVLVWGLWSLPAMGTPRVKAKA